MAMATSTSMMEEDPPFESFSCPITGALMEDPVMTIGACLRRLRVCVRLRCIVYDTPICISTHQPKKINKKNNLAGDGHTYERYAIEEWFRRNHRTSPLTGAPLLNLTLVANITLRNAIEEYRASVDKLQSPGRVTSPGEEKRRALALALDAREERMNEIRRRAWGNKDEEEESGGDPGGMYSRMRLSLVCGKRACDNVTLIAPTTHHPPAQRLRARRTGRTSGTGCARGSC